MRSLTPLSLCSHMLTNLPTFVKDGYEILWIESICEDPGVIAHNVGQLREASPDYVADHDFERRIAFYKKDYVHVEVRRFYPTVPLRARN